MSHEKKKQEIREYCKQLKMRATQENFESFLEDGQHPVEYLHKLLESEVEDTKQRIVDRRIRAAHFPYPKRLEDLETAFLPETLKQRLPEIEGLKFIEKGQNIILTGNPGTGKTHTAMGIGMAACEAGYRVLYTTVPYLVTELKESNDQQKLRRYERQFERYDLVIADELGYVSFDREGADLLFSNLSLRAMTKSTIITSNLTFERWDEVFGDPAITSAMVDRLTYRAILIDMAGESYRFRETLKDNGQTLEAFKKQMEDEDGSDAV